MKNQGSFYPPPLIPKKNPIAAPMADAVAARSQNTFQFPGIAHISTESTKGQNSSFKKVREAIRRGSPMPDKQLPSLPSLT